MSIKSASRSTVDYSPNDRLRVAQLTPPGSRCSIQIGIGLTDAPVGSVRNVYFIVTDIEAARNRLLERGVDVGRPEEIEEAQAAGRLPDGSNGYRAEEIAKSQADLARAQADLVNAKINFDRTKQLADADVYPRQSLDDAAARLRLAEADRDCGLPYMGYEGKAQALTSLGKTGEARSVPEGGLAKATRAREARP